MRRAREPRQRRWGKSRAREHFLRRCKQLQTQETHQIQERTDYSSMVGHALGVDRQGTSATPRVVKKFNQSRSDLSITFQRRSVTGRIWTQPPDREPSSARSTHEPRGANRPFSTGPLESHMLRAEDGSRSVAGGIVVALVAVSGCALCCLSGKVTFSLLHTFIAPILPKTRLWVH